MKANSRKKCLLLPKIVYFSAKSEKKLRKDDFVVRRCLRKG